MQLTPKTKRIAEHAEPCHQPQECPTCRRVAILERDIFGRLECAACFDHEMMRDKMEANFS